MKMETTIPAELLDLKARLDQWRAKRKYLRQPLPPDLRQEVIAISRRYPGALLRRVLKLIPGGSTDRRTKSRCRPPLAKRSRQLSSNCRPTPSCLGHSKPQ